MRHVDAGRPYLPVAPRVGRHVGRTAMAGPRSWSGAKQRLKRPRTVEAAASLEQNVGKIQRRKIREQPRPPVRSGARASKKKLARDTREIRLRALNKLLREIEALQQREEGGDELDAQQRKKCDRLDDVLREIETLLGAGGRATSPQ